MQLIKEQESNKTHISVVVNSRTINIGTIEQTEECKWCACFFRNRFRIISHCISEEDAIIYMAQYAVVGDKISTDNYLRLWNILFPEDKIVIQ
jgi:biotin synthase-like enzyme